MKKAEIVYNKESSKEAVNLAKAYIDSELLETELYDTGSTTFARARRANKIVNDYAVTVLPFVLLIDEEGKEYAAVYSEESPITPERINKKL